ncbi:Ref family protein [Flagellatimonas centrodinii]|uniref:Ref family recombination enhancement nuclease n=1 Tax=Flagellatimonas centrodinii TaxID=2806210 RepID=UPI001FEDD56A|nr:Ref family recombination enhancement nuclease [Flagellatimonas centrodinii]ULQ46959.1 Ref family protein [Flagellatimonas centrodinii]
MPLQRAIPRPTQAQQRRQDNIRELGCLLCMSEGIGWVAAEIHHLTDCGRTISQDHTIGLCQFHHRGVSHYSREQATRIYGPSLAHGAKPFRARFGTNDELLQQQNTALRMAGYADH